MHDYLDRTTASLQPHVPEPILAVGVFSRPGAMGNALVSQVSGAAYLVRNHQAKKAAGGLPHNVVVALTATRLYLFAYRPGWGGKLKVKAPVAVWERTRFVTAVDMPGTLAARVRFHFDDGSQVQLDWNRGFGGEAFNGPIVLALTQPMMASVVYAPTAAA